MVRMRWLSVLLLLSLSLSACSSTNIKDECLVGRWMVTSDELLARAMLPPGAFNQDDLVFKGVGGAVGYDFSQSGVLTLQTVSWQALFDVKVEQTMMQLLLTSNGTATAKVDVAGDQITVGEVTQDLSGFTASLDGQEMMNTVKVGEFAPLFIKNAKTGQYKCEGDNLNITYTDPAGVTYTLVFLRVKGTVQ